MCIDHVDPAIARIRHSIFWYISTGVAMGLVAITVLILSYLPTSPFYQDRDKIVGNIFSAFFGALSVIPVVPIDTRRNKIAYLKMFKQDYQRQIITGSAVSPGPPTIDEKRCHEILQKVLYRMNHDGTIDLS